MIQDIAPHKFHNQYDATATAKPDDFALWIQDGNVLLKSDGTIPNVTNFGEKCSFRYLFTVDAERYFLVSGTEKPAGFSSVSVQTLRRQAMLPKYRIFAVLTAKHLADWYQDTRFCGRCGREMVHSTRERAMCCPACKKSFYPRIMPAVIVGVMNGDQLLLTKYRTGYGHNALIAGFTEIGETLEETVAREVMEEAGLRVKNIRYYKSQPWAVANDILTGFFCEVDGSTEIRMDTNELKYAEFVRREDIVLQPDDFSLTNEMMKLFKEGKH